MKTTAAILLALCVLCTIPLVGCRENAVVPPPNMAALELTVHYRERLLLPPGCRLTVSLNDISRLDPKARPLAQSMVPVQAGPPFAVKLHYDPQRIDDRIHYAVNARITLKGQLLFESTDRVDPFAATAGSPIDVLVRKAAH